MRTSRMAMIVPVVALAFAGLTACGGSDEKSNAGTDAKVLADEAQKLLKSVADYKMVGGGQDEETKIEWDLCIRNGADVQGKMVIDGNPVEMIVVGKDQYMKADAAFWKKSMGESVPPAVLDGVVAKLAGKYMKTPVEDDDSFANMTDFFDGSTDGVTKGEPVKIDGAKVIPLSKKDDEGETTTLYVQEKGKPYPFMVKSEGKGNATMKFTKGKSKCEPTAPAESVTQEDFKRLSQDA
ncbi:hypothetical protein ACFZBU_21330 [Embleya sp. NPDC008237]|uniref:hypothetical protein n=1 Tax=Embleya sp. NPDC008237 TaxID=3363978 RepID=UPI0036E95F4A